MPRLKPPPSQMALEDNNPPTEPIEIALPGDELGETEVELAPQPAPIVERPGPDDNALQNALDGQKRAEELQRSAQRDRDDALRREQERSTELARERDGRQDAEYNSMLTAISAEQSALDKAEADYAGYSSVGDFANAAKAQRIMSTAAARLDRLEDGKLSFEQKRDATKPAPAAPAAAAPLDFEGRISTMPDSAKSWLRKHPEFINDTALNDKIGSAHVYLTKNRNIEPFSEKYFDALDAEFGFKQAPEPEPQPQRRSMPVSAPVSRDIPSTSGVRQPSSKVTLSADERHAAHISIPDTPGLPLLSKADKELIYAKNKQKLQAMRANGQYPQSERN